MSDFGLTLNEPSPLDALLAGTAGAGGTGTSAYASGLTSPFALTPTAPRLLPAPVQSPFGLGQPRTQGLDPTYQAHLTTLTNKYAELASSSEFANVPAAIRNALIQYDSTRVGRGSAPLTREQTINALRTAQTNQPATPPPERNPFALLSNFRGDLSDILKSIPRLPLALAHEAMDIPHIGERIQENQRAGMNGIAAILNAPGVRMIPGAFTLGNLARGGTGALDLARHPLMTFLDLLPAAHGAAAGTEVAKVAEQISEAAGRRPRPLTAVMTGRVLRESDGTLTMGRMPGAASDAPLVPRLGRNKLGALTDIVRYESPIGQAFDSFGGRLSREISQLRGGPEQRYRALFEGYAIPETTREILAKRAGTLFDDYTDQYPFLKTDKSASTPERVAQHADFWRQMQRDPSQLNPEMVGKYNALMYDAAREAEAMGKMYHYRNEWYDVATGKALKAREELLTHSQRMFEYKNRYTNPAPYDPAELTRLIDEVSTAPTRATRGELARAFENTLDAHGMDYKALKSLRTKLREGKATPEQWSAVARKIIAEDTPVPRRTLEQIVAELRKYSRTDPQAALLQRAVAQGDQAGVTRYIKNLQDRKPPKFPEDLYPAFREDVRSMSRRLKFEREIGKTYTDKLIEKRSAQLEGAVTRTAPARWQPLVTDEIERTAPGRLTHASEEALGRDLTPVEAGELTSAILDKRWGNIPGLAHEEVTKLMRSIEREASATWQVLRDKGADPAFVHRVSPGRANQALAGNINPIPVSISQAKRRLIDLSPGIQDMHISVRHQLGELLQQEYNEKFFEDVVDRVGIRANELRERLAPEARERMVANPNLDFEAALETVTRQRYEKFNPETAGTSWGGARLDKYRQEDWFIPKGISYNLHQYAKPPGIFTTITDPITKAFRYSVLGLSPSVVVNNFFSNSVAMTAESGLSPWKYWSTAREWLRNPDAITSEPLKAMMRAEIPNMESVTREAWLATRTGKKFMESMNAGQAFRDSAAYEALRTGKSAMDGVVTKMLRAQQLGDNVYRAMQYMDEYDKLTRAGKSAEAAEHGALEMVRRTFVDYNSFTPIERSAMRTIIPFYSYMGHAARFILRYPFDHPMRAAITAHLAAAEKDRLGALPGSYLSMVPLPGFLGGGRDEYGKENMISLRPFDAFGDISDLAAPAGWFASMNPLIQTALQQVGVVRGESDIYPTLRYDPNTGRMVAVHGNILSDLFHNAVPRAGLLTAALGVNPQYNDVAGRDPDAAKRMLVSMAGLPRAWRQTSPFADMFKGEVARETSADAVRTEALRTGNWTEAMRYPSLRDAYARLLQLTPEQLTAFDAQSPDDIATQVRQLLSTSGGGG